MSNPMIGQINMFGGNFAPRNYALCDGQLIAIAQNTALFSLLGTIYGGDGRTTFALPDLRGRVPVHMGNGPGLTPRQIGEKSGTETITLTVPQLPAHTHTIKCSDEIGTTTNPANNYPAAQPALMQYAQTPASDVMRAVTNTGNSQAHNNQMPFQAINYIIALFGVYPSRS